MTTIQLEIQELTQNQSRRMRRIRVSSDSVTLGTGNDDIELTAIDEKFSVEIKYSGGQWWIVNPNRSNQIRVNGKRVGLEMALSNEDQILLHEHQVEVQIEEEAARIEKQYSFHRRFATDAELWKYLLEEKDFDEVLVNGAKQVYVDYQGTLLLSPWQFSTNSFLREIIETKTKDGSWASWQVDRSLRIQAALPPVVEEPHICIRKARQNVFSLSELEERRFATPEQVRFLQSAINNRESILVSGGTSTGKTVLLRSLVEQIPESQRLLIVEEEAETDWPHPHAVEIEAGRGNLETTVKECLRFRPDRLIISEIRGGEAFDFLQAINTGHEGSMTTLHANSAREALHRIENLILSRGLAVHSEAIRSQMAQAINIVVQLKRDADGFRHIDSVMRITGIQQGVYLMGDPIAFEGSGIQSELKRIR